MASLAAVDPRDHWITPQEQLERLQGLRVPVTEEVSRASGLILAIANMVAEYAEDSSITNWYTAHKRLGTLPQRIPPLPNHIHLILNSKCPIYGDRQRADRTYFKIRDTHFLALIPKELGTLNRFEREILRSYRMRHYPNENPLQFRYFWDPARREHADVPFLETHWVLMTKDILPGSRRKTWADQVALVEALSQKAFVQYEIPTLQQAFAAITLEMVATRKRRYRAGDYKNGYIWTFTHVKETTLGWHLNVGGFAPSGVYSSHRNDYKYEDTGIAALRKF